MNKIRLYLGVFALAIIIPSFTHSDQVPITQPTVALSPVEYADIYTEQYGVDSNVFKKVMFCESGNNPEPRGYNDGGKAYGIMQFHKETFDTYSKQLGEVLDYHSSMDQIKLAAYMFSIKKQTQWSCYSKVVG